MIKFKNIKKDYSKSKNVEFIFVNYDSFSELMELIKEKLPLIGGGEELDYSFDEAKKVYSNYLGQKPRKTQIGSIAELCMHIFLNNEGYTQHCLFFNLEENSIKKGFDGVYTLGDENWFIESKSTENREKDHDYKIKEAINDLEEKIEGHPDNDPWKNAFHHVKSAHIERQHSLLNKLNRFSKMYINNQKISLKEFNIVPCSTLFYENGKSEEEIIINVEEKINNIEFNKIKVLCINNILLDLLLDFFEVKKDGE